MRILFFLSFCLISFVVVDQKSYAQSSGIGEKTYNDYRVEDTTNAKRKLYVAPKQLTKEQQSVREKSYNRSNAASSSSSGNASTDVSDEVQRVVVDSGAEIETMPEREEVATPTEDELKKMVEDASYTEQEARRLYESGKLDYLTDEEE